MSVSRNAMMWQAREPVTNASNVIAASLAGTSLRRQA